MKPGIINLQYVHMPAAKQPLIEWFNANGLRHYVPVDARIIFTGNRLIIPTFDIERYGQKNKAWAKRRFIREANGEIAGLPIKVRTYRVRVPFEAIK